MRCDSQRSCHTVCSVRWVSAWMRPSGISPGAGRTMEKAAMSSPSAVPTGRRMSTRGCRRNPAFASRAWVAGRIGHREGREVQAAITRHRRLELLRQRRVRGLEQELDIAAIEHRGDVPGPGLRWRPAAGIGIDLDRRRRRRKARPHQGACGAVGVRHEMSDMIEKDFVAGRQPAVDVVSVHVASSRRSCLHRPRDASAASRLSAARSILLVVDSGRWSTNQTNGGADRRARWRARTA